MGCSAAVGEAYHMDCSAVVEEAYHMGYFAAAEEVFHMDCFAVGTQPGHLGSGRQVAAGEPQKDLYKLKEVEDHHRDSGQRRILQIVH